MWDERVYMWFVLSDKLKLMFVTCLFWSHTNDPSMIKNRRKHKRPLQNITESLMSLFIYRLLFWYFLFVHLADDVYEHTGSLTNEQILQLLDTCSEFHEHIWKWRLEVQHTLMISSYAFIHKHKHVCITEGGRLRTEHSLHVWSGPEYFTTPS